MNKKYKTITILIITTLLFVISLSGVSAANFNSSSTNAEIQAFLSNTTTTDNEVVFDGGDYSSITGLTVGRSVKISSNGQVNIRGTSGTLFTITSPNVKIVNLNISGYATAINSNRGNLSIIGCNISTTDRSVHLSGNSLTDVLLENNTIISSVNTTTYGAVYINATANSVVKINLKSNNITGNGTSNSTGVRFNTTRCNTTLLFDNNSIKGTGTYCVYLGAYSNSNNNITITNNNITGTSSYGVYLYASTSNNNITITNNNIKIEMSTNSIEVRADTYSNNTITITNNNITGRYIGVYMAVSDGNNNITITNNNITGTTSYGVNLAVGLNNNITITNNNITGTRALYVWAEASNNTITITNNNITGTLYGIELFPFTSNNNITITNNNITGTSNYGIALDTYTNSNNNITITNNNITGATGLYLGAYTNSNNNITITNNNITGALYGVYLIAYTSNNTISFFDNYIMGNYYAMYVNCNNAAFSGLTVVNNTLNATNSSGIGIGFANTNSTVLSDILFTGNNIFAGTTGGTGISFGTGLASVSNVTFNYNRILAATGLNIPTTVSGSVNANLNWWGTNIPRITGMILDNWFVMKLSANSFWTIGNISRNESGLVLLSYDFLLYTNSSNTTSIVGFANLPHFLVDIIWRNSTGTIYNISGADAFLSQSYNVTVSPGSNFTINAMGDFSDVMLTVNRIKLNTSSTIVVPDNVYVGKIINITGVATDENGNPLVNVDLTVVVDGKTYTVITDSNGRWVLAFKPSYTGSMLVSVSWQGNGAYNGFINSTSFNVEKLNTSVTIVAPGNALAGKETTISGVLIDELGDPIASADLEVVVDGKTFSVKTDANGRWSLKYTPTRIGTIDVSVTYNGDNAYRGSTNSTSFNVAKRNIIVTITITENDDGSVTIIANATYEDDGSPASNYPVDFILDGEIVGTGVTDENGIAILTIPANKISDGPHIIIVIVDGGETANNATASVEFTKTSPTNENNTTNKTSNNPVTTHAAMKNTGIPIMAILLVISVLSFVTYRRKL